MKTGINFARCNCGSAQAHNERKAEYLEALERSGKKTYDIFHDRTATNLHSTNPAYAGKSLEQILQDCRERYTASTGQAPQEQDRERVVTDKKTGLRKTVTTAGWSPIREGVCPVKEDTRLSDFNPFIKYLDAKGVRVISIDIHRDEGYQDPATGERKYNYHAHIIADWTDRVTGKTAKLNKADMSAVQTVLADALHMERGESKEVTGKDHLTPAQQREKAAAERAARLEARAAELDATVAAQEAETERAAQAMIEAQQQEAEALRKAQAAEKAASREQLRSNLADAGARVLGLFGRGAVAEAHADRDEALERAEAAEQQAAADRKAREAAEEATETAQEARTAAEKAARRAKQEKDAYGREMYEAGQAEGFKAGRQSVADSIAPLQQQLAEKQATIDRLQRTRDERLDTVTAEARARAEAAEKELADMKAWNSNMLDWQQSVQDMKTAGLSDEDIKSVFRNGSAIVQVSIKHNYKTYPVETVAKIGYRKTAANATKHGVWFKASFDNAWHGVRSFLEKALEHIRALHPSKGLGLH